VLVVPCRVTAAVATGAWASAGIHVLGSDCSIALKASWPCSLPQDSHLEALWDGIKAAGTPRATFLELSMVKRTRNFIGMASKLS
jgi:hypothetical protein